MNSLQKIPCALVLLALLAGTSCDYFKTEEVPDLNNPVLPDVLANPTRQQLDALAVAVEASYRLPHTGNAPYNWVLGVLGREITVQNATESRWYLELPGNSPLTADPPLDNGAFYNAYYVSAARIGRTARVYRQSAQNAAAQVLTEQEKTGINGFARTYEALSKLLLLSLQGEGGIRVELDNELRPGPFVAPDAALTNIRQQLDQAVTELDGAGAAFGFALSPGFAGFSTPATFRKFNRALAARVALYQRDFPGALAALGESFYDRAGDLTLGPKITFNPASAGDQGNASFQVPNAAGANVLTVPDNYAAEAETGDARLAKVALRTTPRTTGGITGRYDVRRFASNTAPLDIIRNEELVLIAAEARAGTGDFAGALEDINAIRTGAGKLPVLASLPNDFGAYTDEILRQRRYSLFFEGHWLLDLRRLNRLTAAPAPGITLPFSTAPYRLIPRMPRPATEVAWDQANP